MATNLLRKWTDEVNKKAQKNNAASDVGPKPASEVKTTTTTPSAPFSTQGYTPGTTSAKTTGNSQYTGTTYDPNANYQDMINKAVASGDYVSAAKYEQLRNQKIADTGSTYDPTNLYSGWLDNTDYATIGKSQMANGASWEEVLDTYNKRYNKANGTVGLEQYANDEFQQMMLSYINQGKALEKAQNYMDEWEDENPKEEFDSKYDARIDRILNEILNRDDFSYDMYNDPLYQQYADQYRREGDRASREAMAAAAASAGGMNTWAMTAANQANQYYNSQLNDRIPELYQLAYNMYLNDKESMVQDLGILQDMDSTQYNRYRDTINDWYNDKNFAYGEYYDALQQGNWQTTNDYNAKWDNINYNTDQAWANKEWEYNDAWKNKEWDADQSQLQLENSWYEDKVAKEDAQQALENKWYEDDVAKKDAQQALENSWYEDAVKKEDAQLGLTNSRYDKESAQEEIWKYISLGVQPSADLIAAAGMSETDVSLAVAAAKAELEAQKKNSVSSGSGSGGGSGSGSGGGSPSKSSTDSGYTPKDTSTSSSDDYKITNGHGDDWVAIANMGRVSYQELENMVNKGTVVEVVDEKNKTISYRKASTKTAAEKSGSTAGSILGKLK